MEPHKFVLSYMGYCMCGLFHDDPIHQPESQPERHKFAYCEVANCDCGLCVKCSQAMNDQIHQQESQPEPEGWMLQEAGIVHPWEDTHQHESQPETVTDEMVEAAWFKQGMLTHEEMRKCLQAALEERSK